MIEIGPAELSCMHGHAKLSCPVSCDDDSIRFPGQLWFSYPEVYAESLAFEKLDWALVGLLLPAMRSRQPIRISGAISPLLLSAVRTDIQAMLSINNSSVTTVNIELVNFTTSKTEPIVRGAKNDVVATGFSAGVDSFSTIALSRSELLMRLTHLVTLNVGALEEGPDADKLHKNYALRLERYCRSVGLQAIPIDSNLAHFYSPLKLTHERSHTLRAAAALLPMENNVDVFYYSSSVDYSHTGVYEHHALGALEPMLLPLLSTEQLQFRASATPYTRIEKTQMISELPETHDYLDVCVKSPTERLAAERINCSTCSKCARTMLSLDLLGQLQRYATVFDLNFYQNNKRALIQSLILGALLGDEELDLEVLQFAVKKGAIGARWLALGKKSARVSWKLCNAMSKLLAARLAKSL